MYTKNKTNILSFFTDITVAKYYNVVLQIEEALEPAMSLVLVILQQNSQLFW